MREAEIHTLREEPYLLELVRCIRLNPLRVEAVKDIDELSGYPRCDHSTLTGNVSRDRQETEYVLRLFGGRLRQTRRAYESSLWPKAWIGAEGRSWSVEG